MSIRTRTSSKTSLSVLAASALAIAALAVAGRGNTMCLLAPACVLLPGSVWLWLSARRRLALAQVALSSLEAGRQVDQFRLARRDVLTGLANRQGFAETLSALFAAERDVAVMVIDLSGLDRINANLGEAAGDELLSGFAKRLQACTERDHAARLAGSRFGLVLTAPGDLKALPQAADRVMAALSVAHVAAGQVIDIALSIGVAAAGLHGDCAETLLRAARLTTEQARQAGGARWLICGQDVAEMVLQRQTSRRDMQRAIEAGQIVPYYQPIVRLPDGEIAQFEVLARWIHPALGVLLPDQFIPLANDLGLAGQISMSLLRRMALETQHWPRGCRLAIKVSAGQVRELIGLLTAQPGDWQRRMDLSRLNLEVSACALMRDRQLARDLIDALHEHGARAVLDDFGSGQANFCHLEDLPFDSIKIGKSFIRRLTDDNRVEACVAAMLSLGSGLGIDIVADGVETAAVAARLAELGCSQAQGFLYAHPMPASEAARLLGVDVEVCEAA